MFKKKIRTSDPVEERFDNMMRLVKDLPRADYNRLKKAMELGYESYQTIKNGIKMKLKNKRTGEIVGTEGRPFIINSGKQIYRYESVKELEEEWEDYEEPEDYWFINDLDGKPMKCELRYCPVRSFTEWSEKRKQIGNYFSSREEAEEVLRKLKAWKRLKDKGFKFIGWHIGEISKNTNNRIEFRFHSEGFDWRDVKDDLDLLFSQEDD